MSNPTLLQNHPLGRNQAPLGTGEAASGKGLIFWNWPPQNSFGGSGSEPGPGLSFVCPSGLGVGGKGQLFLTSLPACEAWLCILGSCVLTSPVNESQDTAFVQ